MFIKKCILFCLFTVYAETNDTIPKYLFVGASAGIVSACHESGSAYAALKSPQVEKEKASAGVNCIITTHPSFPALCLDQMTMSVHYCIGCK